MNKKIIWFLIFIVSISSILSVSATNVPIGSTYNLTISGRILYVGGSGPGNYSRIQDAIDNASDGDAVFVFSGTYFENVYINKSINLLGENRETTIIDANGTGDSILLVSNNITIDGFTIQKGKSGIKLYKSNDNIIKNNKIKGNYFGIELYYLSNNTISDNKIFQNKVGIDGTDSYFSIIQNNEILYNNGMGITLSFSYNNKIINNYIEGNNANDSNPHANIFLFKSLFNDILKNNISNHSEIGIGLGLSYGNRISLNNFIYNTEDIVFEYGFLHWALLGNSFQKNYWDTYNGKGPKIIMGSFEGIITFIIRTIKIPWFEFDWYPAKEPYDIKVDL